MRDPRRSHSRVRQWSSSTNLLSTSSTPSPRTAADDSFGRGARRAPRVRTADLLRPQTGHWVPPSLALPPAAVSDRHCSCGLRGGCPARRSPLLKRWLELDGSDLPTALDPLLLFDGDVSDARLELHGPKSSDETRSQPIERRTANATSKRRTAVGARLSTLVPTRFSPEDGSDRGYSDCSSGDRSGQHGLRRHVIDDVAQRRRNHG